MGHWFWRLSRASSLWTGGGQRVKEETLYKKLGLDVAVREFPFKKDYKLEVARLFLFTTAVAKQQFTLASFSTFSPNCCLMKL